MKWETKELQDAVRVAHGDKYANAIHRPLKSFDWKSRIAYYHACEADMIIEEAVKASPGYQTHFPSTLNLGVAILFSAAGGDTSQNLRLAQFKAEAHIIASAQALHSLCDILCHVVYWAYCLDTVPKAPATKRLNLHSLLRVLNQLPKYSATASLIQKVLDSEEFKYLVAYVNTTKHKSLVNSTLNSSLNKEGRGGMQIEAFSYTDFSGKSCNFDKKWAHDFLLPESQSIRLKLVEVGNSLNAHFK